MNYPVWALTTAGGGLLIALMAVFHVYIAHFAVGGGLFLVLLEKKAYARQSDELLGYLKRHARFFLLLTMVLGGITGVGIWFTIALLNPAATSSLIHTFVFGWATEWVCFVGEIIALFIYYYTFGKMRPAQHLRIGWLYFIFAWLSLFLIKGQPGLLNFPAAIHGWHANYLTDRGTEACYRCHPSRPGGPTRCLRGIHAATMDCTHCHGTLEDHALSLLKGEKIAGKLGAERLMRHIEPRMVATLDQINARTPWINEPDCLNCHVDFKRPDPATANAFNQWTSGPEALYRIRHDQTKSMMCEACHGSTHAVYPATNILDAQRDNIQPLQYQGNNRSIGRKNCRLCHTKARTGVGHHPLPATAGF
ncbi:cytochrome c family protein (probable cytochrome bd ubiquinol oxidase, subunit I) [Desulfosarcina variabilis str. Montpellier]|uniref:cytochrome ubiquinol oxidase subunit I n=1 Tax=Desulfosarcina variabilis TaxID=2300 RepID=UPI003AFB0663